MTCPAIFISLNPTLPPGEPPTSVGVLLYERFISRSPPCARFHHSGDEGSQDTACDFSDLTTGGDSDVAFPTGGKAPGDLRPRLAFARQPVGRRLISAA